MRVITVKSIKPVAGSIDFVPGINDENGGGNRFGNHRRQRGAADPHFRKTEIAEDQQVIADNIDDQHDPRTPT